MTKHISPLRQRMLDDMAMRNMSPNTQKVYTYPVANFARYHHQSPDKFGIEHIGDYRLHLLARGLKLRSVNPIVGALRFFYGTTFGNKALAEQIPFARLDDTLPAVLRREQVLRISTLSRMIMHRSPHLYAIFSQASWTVFQWLEFAPSLPRRRALARAVIERDRRGPLLA